MDEKRDAPLAEADQKLTALDDSVIPLQRASKPELPEVTPTATFFARFGTFMLKLPCDGPNSVDVVKAIEAALRAEPRVSALAEVQYRKDWVSRSVSYPWSRDVDEDAILSGDDHFHSVTFSDPISFTVTVPIKNQPIFRGYDDIPTDTYWVAWDGVTAVVSWARDPAVTPDSGGIAPRSGGQVVVDVLTDVAQRAGFDLYVQACSPNCQNLFAHRVLWLDQVGPDVDQPRLIITRESTGPGVAVRLKSESEPQGLATDLHWAIYLESGYFARFKNLARRMMQIEELARDLVDDLLQIQYARNKRRRLNWVKRVKAAFDARGEGKRAEEIIASLWIAFSRLESIRSTWFPVRDRFVEVAEKFGTRTLFVQDQKDDERAVERQDLGFIRGAVEQSASRIDARYVALLTGLTAVAGLIGALVGVAAS